MRCNKQSDAAAAADQDQAKPLQAVTQPGPCWAIFSLLPKASSGRSGPILWLFSSKISRTNWKRPAI